MLTYLADLASNNNREWYHQHKAAKKAATAVFEHIVLELTQRIGVLENVSLAHPPKELIFRLNRDIRFSSDKKPYNPAFRARDHPQAEYLKHKSWYAQSFIADGVGC